MKPGNKAAVPVLSVRERESTPKQQQPSSQTQIQIVLPFSTAPDKFDICQTTDCSCANLTQTLIHGCSLLHKTLNVHLRGQLSLHPKRELSLPACWPLQACLVFPSCGGERKILGLLACVQKEHRSFTDEGRISPLSLICCDHHQPATSFNASPQEQQENTTCGYQLPPGC